MTNKSLGDDNKNLDNLNNLDSEDLESIDSDPATDNDDDIDDEDLSDDDDDVKSEEINATESINEENSANVPLALSVKDQIFDVAFHPAKNVIATAEISGKICLFSYSLEENKKLCDLRHHKKACRSLAFTPDGEKLYSCSKDKSIQVVDLNTGSVIHTIPDAHTKAINTMKLISNNHIATGSDDGVVKLWDCRTFSMVCEFSNCKDYISDMAHDKEGRFLLCTSGDGLLSKYNMRQHKLQQVSDQLDEELLSVAIMKNGQKIVCGSADGTLNIFSWDDIGDITDRIPSNSMSIDAICPITEDILCTGADDACIRSLFLSPHRALGVVGKHGTLGIENLRLSRDKELMASCANCENTVKFWDVSNLQKESIEPLQQKKKQRKRKNEESSNDNFFADL